MVCCLNLTDLHKHRQHNGGGLDASIITHLVTSLSILKNVQNLVLNTSRFSLYLHYVH